MTPQIEIQIIVILVALSCALSGVFLVLRGMSMMTDAIGHTVLLGIVLGFFISGRLDSPILFLGAGAFGIVTAYGVEVLSKTRLIKEDASIGLVFPFLFSIAIILITRFAGNVHLDTDSVLLGELAFAPLERIQAFGMDIGPKSMVVMSIILIINIGYFMLFYKELKLGTFDPQFAQAAGFSTLFIHYSLMSIVSFTSVGAFDAVGAILVVAFMVGPPASAYLLTSRLLPMILTSCGIGVINSIIGYIVAINLDISISGTIASTTLVTFIVCFVISVYMKLRNRTQNIIIESHN
ncbi:zinc transport system membrane protein TroD [Gottschalkia purinilytica]|uniref:Zinc transport system membrane protein TroD n=1 Tax=Gottschalkia purinilytica TaxID=1503 RepID=A0A0L0WAU2_GOTPU|nr:metal ABC transporter permease [Gottschalkia purinilytica]KNF08608.1 zinc transport system membrane protein TroD [Gottschalkia purinilytica]